MLDSLIVAGSYPEFDFEAYGALTPFIKIRVDYVKWSPGDDLAVTTLAVDFVIFTSHATEYLQEEGLELALRETVPVLRPGGQILVFLEDETMMPESAELNFNVADVVTGTSEVGLTMYRLFPKPIEAVAPVRKRRRRRRVPPANEGA